MKYPNMKRFTRDELAVAIHDATVSGRVYAKQGEQQRPAEFAEYAFNHALGAVAAYRRAEQKRRRQSRTDNAE